MVAEQPESELRAELEEIERELAELRRTAADLRRSIAEGNGPQDSADLSASLTAAEEQEAVIEVLEARREALRQRLGEG